METPNPNSWGELTPLHSQQHRASELPSVSEPLRATTAEMRQWGVDPSDPEFADTAAEAVRGTQMERITQEASRAALYAAFNGRFDG